MGSDGNGQMGSMFDSSGWDPIHPLSLNGNLGASMMVSHPNFGNPSYPIASESKGPSGSSQFMHYDSSGIEMLPKFPAFGGGSFSGIANSYSLPGCIDNVTIGSVQSQEDPQISEERSRLASPNGKRKRKDSSGEISEIKEMDEKKQKIEESGSSDQSSKQTGRQTKDNCSGEEDSKGYIHVRARRGQATNSHSLAERVRREKINERMRLLQELVPGCTKITGKAVMLDEIINYVQSLQQQVEFLSMKLASVNPDLNFDVEQILSKEILQSRGIPGFNPGTTSAHIGAPGSHHGALPMISNTISPYHPMPQGIWDGDLQTLHHMGLGFELNPAIGNLGSNGTQ